MQVKESKRKRIIIIIILSLAVFVALLQTKFAVRCMLVARLSWEISFSTEADIDYIDESKGVVFCNKNSLIWLREQAWEAQIELIPIGTQLVTSPAPSYYVGNTFIGDDGRLSYRFLITTYHFYIERHNVLLD